VISDIPQFTERLYSMRIDKKCGTSYAELYRITIAYRYAYVSYVARLLIYAERHDFAIPRLFTEML